jgi:hypothetical protein
MVEFFAHFLGYIARECITKEELEKLIAYGVGPGELVENIKQRMDKKEGLRLGTQYIRLFQYLLVGIIPRSIL